MDIVKKSKKYDMIWRASRFGAYNETKEITKIMENHNEFIREQINNIQRLVSNFKIISHTNSTSATEGMVFYATQILYEYDG